MRQYRRKICDEHIWYVIRVPCEGRIIFVYSYFEVLRNKN
jgi:hypothetical protein